MDQDELITYQKAVIGPNSKKWLEAMKSMMDSMYANHVWILVDLPEGVKPIRCKWVFKKNTDINANVCTFKGQPIVKGFKQIHDINYDETFSLVVMLKFIEIFLTIVTYYNYEI